MLVPLFTLVFPAFAFDGNAVDTQALGNASGSAFGSSYGDARRLRPIHRPPYRGYRAPPRHQPPEPERSPVASTHHVSLTASVLDPAVGAFGLGAEFRATPQLGVGLEGALGSNGEIGLYRVGVDVRQYFVGNFDTGLFVGVGVDAGNYHFFAPIEPNVAVGPTLGAKFTVPVIPITLSGSVGADLVVSDTRLMVAPSLAASVGFSF